MSDLKKLTDALKDAELEVRALTEGGWLFHNGVRYVSHPPDCECGSYVVPQGTHCFCCGHLEYGAKCSCARAVETGICTECGLCTLHCDCEREAE